MIFCPLPLSAFQCLTPLFAHSSLSRLPSLHLVAAVFFCSLWSKAHFYTRSQGWKNLRPTLSTFGLLFGPTLLINAGTLALRVADWLHKFPDGILFPALGPMQGHKVQHLLVAWGRLKIFFLFQPGFLVWSPWGQFQLLHQ
jgi:hypothetical protein